jgi:polyketide biosynthesis enoyl-CoA hydratase PksH
MGGVVNMANFNTVCARLDNEIGILQIYRPAANNTINDELVYECHEVLAMWRESAKIIVIEGLPEVFCFGADFKGIADTVEQDASDAQDPSRLYSVWLELAQGPFISIAKVQGKANAGGMGFVSACDIVLADKNAVFSLSELLFSLMPACVLPFLINKVGVQKAHYMTLMTQPITAETAHQMGLVDAIHDNVDDLLRRHLLRLNRLSKTGILRYKNYMNQLNQLLVVSQDKAVAANKQVFSDKANLDKIARYVKTGKFPWEE